MSGDAPSAPDPYALAQAQAAANTASAKQQAKLAMTGQVTPTGSLTYVKDKNSPSGYKAITEYTPEQQALLEQFQQLTGQFGDVSGQQIGMYGDQLGRVNDVVSSPFDLNAARANEITDIQQNFLTPQWDQRKEALEADLLNRGIRPGSDQYENMMRQFSQSRDDSYDKMFLDAWQLANNAALTERNLPLADLAVLRGASPTQQPTNPQFVTTPTPGVAPTDLTSAVYNSYNAEMNANNAQMGGLFGLGSSLLGGWAQSAPGSALITKGITGLAALSDRRLKTEIRKIGDDPRGWGVYLFTYLMDGMRELGTQIGFMADEIEKVRPEVVFTDERTGFKAVDYGALALA